MTGDAETRGRIVHAAERLRQAYGSTLPPAAGVDVVAALLRAHFYGHAPYPARLVGEVGARVKRDAERWTGEPCEPWAGQYADELPGWARGFAARFVDRYGIGGMCDPQYVGNVAHGVMLGLCPCNRRECRDAELIRQHAGC